jgi:predicted acylesterase/phospholipase RssA
MKQKILPLIKKAVSLLIISVAILSADTGRPKVGLALSGGGAMGFAHIAALQLIDSLGIPIDMIVGTSMGGLVGGLYAIGYSGNQLEELARNIDWLDLMQDHPSRQELPYLLRQHTEKYQIQLGIEDLRPKFSAGLIQGQKIGLLLNELTLQYSRIRDFDQLPIPYRCTAVDVKRGNLHILKEGNLAKAMRATMSIPTVFVPVEWDSLLLVDGGALNNFPVDVVKEMGADIIIGVSVASTTELKSESSVEILIHTMNMIRNHSIAKNSALADLSIDIRLKGITPADFAPEKIESTMNQGRKFASEARTNLAELQKKYKLYKFDDVEELIPENILLGDLLVTGNISLADTMIMAESNIDKGQQYSADSLKAYLHKLNNKFPSRRFRFRLRPVQQTGYANLLIEVVENVKPQIHSIEIVGNEKLSFAFIYNLLGIRPGQIFDGVLLHSRINDLYNLGYFNSITYELLPSSDERVKVKIIVKEKPEHTLGLGFSFHPDDKALLGIGMRHLNLPFAGSNLDYHIILGERLAFQLRYNYPSRSYDLPVYPLFRVDADRRSRPVRMPDGKNLGDYQFQLFKAVSGIGIQAGMHWNLELLLTHYAFGMKSKIVQSNELFYPRRQESVRSLGLRWTVDRFDNRLLPKKGYRLDVQYHNGLAMLKSERDFEWLQFRYDFLLPIVGDIVWRNRLTANGAGGEMPWGFRIEELLADEHFGIRPYYHSEADFYSLMSAIRWDLSPFLYLQAAFDFRFNEEYNDFDTKEPKSIHQGGFGLSIGSLNQLGNLELTLEDDFSGPGIAPNLKFSFCAGFSL